MFQELNLLAEPELVGSKRKKRKKEKRSEETRSVDIEGTFVSAVLAMIYSPSYTNLASAPASQEREKKRKREEAEAEVQAAEHSSSESKRAKKEKKRRRREETSETTPSGPSTFTESSSAPSKAVSPAPRPTTSITPTTPAEASAFLTKHSITIHTPPDVPSVIPVINFSQLDVPTELRSAFARFKEPTPIQACTWPPALEGRDVVGIAETGSGKTLAFGIPALVRLINSENKNYSKSVKSTVSILVVAPTRELAIQTHDTLSALGKPFGIASVAVFGGVPKEPQVKMLKNANKGKDGLTTRIIVGTPGRILDLMQEGACDLSG
jgi:ATP-dependent RNA helicase DBP3